MGVAVLACLLLQALQAFTPGEGAWFGDAATLAADTEEATEEWTEAPEPQPFFEAHLNHTSMVTRFGSSVFLPCKVENLRGQIVSWVRRHGAQPQLLTVGAQPYSSDSRFAPAFLAPNDWRLHIRFANERDEGHYECQVSSHPPIVFYVLLTVLVPQVRIVDDRGDEVQEKFYKAGSTIELRCVVTHAPGHVSWRHGRRLLNYDTSRGGISVKTDMTTDGATSRLFVANAAPRDSGTYSCSLPAVAPAEVSVHILNGENPAAMQHGCAVCSCHIAHPLLLLLPLLCR